ncbi:MAG: chemotaxis protein CheR [Gammaproteobacteria bacterium]|nr:chemotaxis protein CheR [Gammaproteobacteria bacterium]
MKDADCVEFLQWALPNLQLRWPGFRKVRGQVCKRLARRLQELQCPDVEFYRGYLETHPEEWRVLDGLCQVTISRFYREKAVFQFLENTVLPALLQRVIAREEKYLNILSLGSASGEEPYAISMLWHFRFQKQYPDITLRVTATEANPELIQRSRQACYPYSGIKNLPPDWRATAFQQIKDNYCLNPQYHQSVHFVQQDVRNNIPPGPFDLVLCRNLVFTYFDEALQNTILDRIALVLRDEGILVLGIHENLPANQTAFIPWSGKLRVFIKNKKA